MKTRRIIPSLVVIAALCLIGACGKEKAADKVEPSPSKPTPSEPAPTEPTPIEPAVAQDYIKVEASHAKPKPSDPVLVQFTKFEIKEASFESPDNLEGATATVEIDVASLKSDKAGRDKHLREPDYLDTDAFALSTVWVSNVKRLDTNSYSADLKVSLHGQEDTWQVDFVVADKTADSVTIEMQHTFERRTFGIGAEDASPAQDILVQVRLTFKKS